MTCRTSIAAGIDITAKRAAYDAVCKRLISEKIILAWIMHSCLSEFREIDVKTIAEKYIEGQPYVNQVPINPDMTGAFLQNSGQEQTSPTEGDIYFDIYFRAVIPDKDETAQLIINIEAQRDYYPGYPLVKRALYYCARMLSAQKGKVFSHSEYGKLRKVYSVWLCLEPPQYLTSSITAFHIAKDNILGSNPEKPTNYDLLTVIILGLDDADKTQNEGIIKLLSVLLSNKITASDKKRILQNEFTIPMTQELEIEVNTMFDLSQSLIEESEARGEARGKDIGIKIGIEQNIIASIKSLMATLKLSAQEAMNALRIPENDQPHYLEKIANN
ncbi:MAG: hypothetical protein Q4F00_09555 [bacterium]|nr:hypothetical protein [bacterium]